MKKEITFKELKSLGYKDKSIKEEIQSNMLTRIKSGKNVFNGLFGYEDTVIDYIKPETQHKYTIDFTLPNGILIETKGRWVLEDRKKHMLIRQQHPELDIRIVFQNPRGKIRKGSKTTYADYCEKHGIKWAEKEIPSDWLK